MPAISFLFSPSGLPTVLNTPRGFLGHWWKLLELKRWLTLDIIYRKIWELSSVFKKRVGIQ